MSDITFTGKPVHTHADLPPLGTDLGGVILVGTDLTEISVADYAGRRVVVNVFPSVDTDVCAASVRRFNAAAAGLDNTTVLCVSHDLPFALARFCGAEGIKNVVAASAFRSSFGTATGAVMTDGPLEGLLSRCVIILDEDGHVRYTQQVPEITEEPDYDEALAVLKELI